MVHIVVVDDHPLYLEGLKNILEKDSGYNIVASLTDGDELLDILNHTKVDIALLDINMGNMNGIQLAEAVRKMHAKVKIVFLSSIIDEMVIERAKKLGAYGAISKSENIDVLIEKLHSVSIGEKAYPTDAEIFEHLYGNLKKKHHITKQEILVLQKIKQSSTSKQIAADLSISVDTVLTHKKNIYSKIGVKKVTDLLNYLKQNATF